MTPGGRLCANNKNLQNRSLYGGSHEITLTVPLSLHFCKQRYEGFLQKWRQGECNHPCKLQKGNLQFKNRNKQ